MLLCVFVRAIKKDGWWDTMLRLCAVVTCMLWEEKSVIYANSVERDEYNGFVLYFFSSVCHIEANIGNMLAAHASFSPSIRSWLLMVLCFNLLSAVQRSECYCRLHYYSFSHYYCSQLLCMCIFCTCIKTVLELEHGQKSEMRCAYKCAIDML